MMNSSHQIRPTDPNSRRKSDLASSIVSGNNVNFPWESAVQNEPSLHPQPSGPVSYSYNNSPVAPQLTWRNPFIPTTLCNSPPRNSVDETQLANPAASWPSGKNGEYSTDLFPKTRLDRKRKVSSPETFRPSKVMITEAALAQGLDNLQLTGTGSANLNSHGIPPVDGSAPSVEQMEPETWETFRDTDFMDVDIEPSGRRVCPQLEMSESLKEAIRLIDREESSVFPEAILNQIMPSAPKPCMALVPYNPSIKQLLIKIDEKPSLHESRKTAKSRLPDVVASSDVPMEDS